MLGRRDRQLLEQRHEGFHHRGVGGGGGELLFELRTHLVPLSPQPHHCRRVARGGCSTGVGQRLAGRETRCRQHGNDFPVPQQLCP